MVCGNWDKVDCIPGNWEGVSCCLGVDCDTYNDSTSVACNAVACLAVACEGDSPCDEGGGGGGYPDVGDPIITTFVVNGDSTWSAVLTVPVNVLNATDDRSLPADMSYLVQLSTDAPPPAGDPRWVPYSQRLDPVSVLTMGTYTFTAFAKDEESNVSRGLNSVTIVFSDEPAGLETSVACNAVACNAIACAP